MTTDYKIRRLEMQHYNMILTEKLQKYLHFHQVKWVNMNILKVKKYYALIEVK